MTHRTLLTAGAALAFWFWSADARAMCFWTADGQRPWTNGTYVYEFDASADNPVTACGLANNLSPQELAEYLNPDTQQYYTVRELFLEGLADWLEDDDFPVGLAPQAYTGVEPERVVVTAFCGESNHHSTEYVNGYGVVRHLNLRPTTHTKVRFHRTVRHETGHSFGMAHMHQRWDRANHITVRSQNISPGNLADYSVLSVSNCNKMNLLLPYDLRSIMHYIPPLNPNCSTTKASGCTLSPGSPDPNDPDYNPNYGQDFAAIQNAVEISILDRRALQFYYPQHSPDRPGVYNPEARLWSFLSMNQGVIAGELPSNVIRSVDVYQGIQHRAIYGDGMPTARPLVAPWDPLSPLDRLGEVYYLGGRDPFIFQGDANANGSEADDAHRELDAYAMSKVVTVDTALGVQVLAYVPSMDIVLYDEDDDGFIDHQTSTCGVFFPSWADEPFSGDFNGDGKRTLAVRGAITGMIHIDLDGDLEFDTWTYPWLPGVDVRPFAGDWNGDGRDNIGVYDPSTRTFYLDRDGTGAIETDTSMACDAIFQLDGNAPQPGAPDLWPIGGQFDEVTVRDDIKRTFPWSLPDCQVMSDDQNYCWEAWGWCEDVGAASDQCYPYVECGEYIGVGFKDFDIPPGCYEVDYALVCDLNPDCTPV